MSWLSGGGGAVVAQPCANSRISEHPAVTVAMNFERPTSFALPPASFEARIRRCIHARRLYVMALLMAAPSDDLRIEPRIAVGKSERKRSAKRGARRYDGKPMTIGPPTSDGSQPNRDLKDETSVPVRSLS